LVSVLIPAYNEAGTLAVTVKAVLSVPAVEQVVVVDDASQDETAALAAAAGAEVIRLPANRGKGGALNAGLPRLRGGIVALLDADLGESAAELAKLLAPVAEGRADMTVARFPRSRIKGGFGLVKGLARKGIYYYTGLMVQAPLSGQRVMRREVLDVITPFASGYGVEVGMTIDVARRGFRVEEVETNMTHHETGRDWRGWLHRGRQFLHVLMALACRWKPGRQA
jgi:glycosyltransferase involved in cell wall biosynthesis